MTALLCFVILCRTTHHMMVLCREYWILAGFVLCHMQTLQNLLNSHAQCWTLGALRKGSGGPQLLGCKVIPKFSQNASAFWILRKILMYTANILQSTQPILCVPAKKRCLTREIARTCDSRERTEDAQRTHRGRTEERHAPKCSLFLLLSLWPWLGVLNNVFFLSTC